MPRRLALATVVALAALAACDDRGRDVDRVAQAFTSQCATDVVEGVDVYSGQGTIDWTQVAGAGIGFAFIKASQGNYGTQSTFHDNWTGAKSAGVLRGAYHFFDGTVDGVTQANFYLAALAAEGGLQPGDLPPMLDLECPTSANEAQSESGCEYSGDSGWVDQATLIQRTFDWLATVEAATGRKALIYSYPSWFGDNGVTDSRLAGYPLYIATYATCASVPAPWTSAVFWQYGDDGTVAGIHGGVDVDRFFGTAAELTAFAAEVDMPDAGSVDARVAAGPDANAGGTHETGGVTVSSGCRIGDVGGANGPRASRLVWALTASAAAIWRRRRVTSRGGRKTTA